MYETLLEPRKNVVFSEGPTQEHEEMAANQKEDYANSALNPRVCQSDSDATVFVSSCVKAFGDYVIDNRGHIKQIADATLQARRRPRARTPSTSPARSPSLSPSPARRASPESVPTPATAAPIEEPVTVTIESIDSSTEEQVAAAGAVHQRRIVVKKKRTNGLTRGLTE